MDFEGHPTPPHPCPSCLGLGAGPADGFVCLACAGSGDMPAGPPRFMGIEGATFDDVWSDAGSGPSTPDERAEWAALMGEAS